MHRPLVAGNWKMNLTRSAGLELVAGVRAGLEARGVGEQVEVAVCPPHVYLVPVGEALSGSAVQLGAQNLYHEGKGAFTGEISPQMLADVGCKYVIIGHSERRHTIGHLEDDRMINLKVRAARAAGLIPILCVGETLAEREAERTMEVLSFQMAAGLVGHEIKAAEDLVVAYEPVWAIGTGRNATPEQAQAAHAHLRGVLRGLAGAAADDVRILYGGSMKPENAGEIIARPDVDGGLVGGASLKADAFVGIVAAALAVVA
jgi:triosephosphate isomerase